MTNTRLQKNSTKISPVADDIALKFISFLVSDDERLNRFCALTGMGEPELKMGLSDATVQSFILDYALSDESLLLAFAADHGLRPEDVVRARQHLPGFSG
jgi:hypothetical protein